MNKRLLHRVVAAALLFAICAIILFPIFTRVRPGNYGSCQSNLKQIGLAFSQYLQDYDGKYPLVMTPDGNFGWANSLQAYLKSTMILRCPHMDIDNRINVIPRSVGYTDYWYNERLNGLTEKKIRHTALTILSGDGNDGRDGTNARYSLSELPSEWLADKNSPCYRHVGGANYLFSDGHVKWFVPEKIKSTMEGDSPTFAVR